MQKHYYNPTPQLQPYPGEEGLFALVDASILPDTNNQCNKKTRQQRQQVRCSLEI
jgi:hypothetical protein